MAAKHKRSTRNNHGCLLGKHLLPHFGDMCMDEITPSDVSDLLDGLRSRLAPNTLSATYCLLHLLFDLACQYDLIETSPVRPKLHRPDVPKVEKPVLAVEQIRAVLAELPALDRLYLTLLSVTGLRMNEGLALRWMDFDEASSEITISHTLYRYGLETPKTEASRATIHLDLTIARMLAEHRAQSQFRAEGNFIFCRADGRPLSDLTLRERLYKAMDRAGIKRLKRKHGFHIFRHTAGSLLYDKVRDVKQVQAMLRHADITTTADIYVHTGEKVIREATGILVAEILGNSGANCDLTVTQASEMVS